LPSQASWLILDSATTPKSRQRAKPQILSGSTVSGAEPALNLCSMPAAWDHASKYYRIGGEIANRLLGLATIPCAARQPEMQDSIVLRGQKRAYLPYPISHATFAACLPHSNICPTVLDVSRFSFPLIVARPHSFSGPWLVFEFGIGQRKHSPALTWPSIKS
jgi:hypothetical protein